MKKFRNISTAFLAFVVGATMLSACGSSAAPASPSPSDAAPAASASADAAASPAASADASAAPASATPAKAEQLTPNTPGQFVYNIGSATKTLDPTLNNAVDGAMILCNLWEGLLRVDPDTNMVKEGVADKWSVSDDGLTYKFHLRPDAKWTDGKPVVAGDFVYSWTRALDPKTAADYSYQMFYIKNGEAFFHGKATADQLGVKAIDDANLEVTLEAPTAFFPSLLAFATYFPERKDIIEAHPDTWANDPSTYVSNGMYKLTEFVLKSDIIIEATPTYWNASIVKMPKVEITYVDDPTTSFQSFKAGDFDGVYTVPAAEVPTGIADKSVTVFPMIGTYFYCLNMDPAATDKIDPASTKALQDPRVREALSLAIDRTKITQFVSKGGEVPAHGFVPPGMKNSDGTNFAEKEYFPPAGDVAKAQKLLADAGFPGGKGFPAGMTLTYNTGASHKEISEAVQDMWKNNLGITINLQNQEWQVFEKTRTDGNYLVARHGWIGDYQDPMTFLGMWVTVSGQNNAKYHNENYDKLIAAAQKEGDLKKRDADLHQAEDQIMKDLPIIPLYYYTQPMAFQPYVKGIKWSPLGYLFFDQVTVDK